MTRVKICGIQNESDLKVAVQAGADAVGFLVGQIHASSQFILASSAARLVNALPPYVQPVLVTHLTAPSEIQEIVNRSGIHTVQLHGGSTPEEVQQLRSLLPQGAKLIVAVHLRSESQINYLMDYYSCADAFVLDNAIPSEGKVGGTGRVCDWSLAARFVKFCPIPVTLAGGLCGENVADAIRTVAPFAVDANTRLKNPDGSLNLDLATAFCTAAKRV